MVESLWSIPAANNIRAPLIIMKEQATALTEQTKGSLVGLVETGTYGAGDLVINLSIQVPSLNNYKYRLMTYTQPVTMYPGTLAAQVPVASGTSLTGLINSLGLGPQAIEVKNEQEFVAALKGLLALDEVKRLVSSLLVQANAA
jgi:hypothetical protein